MWTAGVLAAALALASPVRAATPSSYVMLMLGEPTVEGDLAGTELLLTLSQHESSLRSCFLGTPSAAGPRDEQVTIWLDLDAKGHVTKVDARSDAAGDRSILEHCLEGVVRLASFPAPGGDGAHIAMPVGVAILEEPPPRDMGALIEPAKGLEVGAPAPPLTLAKLIGAPPGTEVSWDSLHGRVVVLEFWATWCGPCLAAVPHLRVLAAEFADEGVVFLSITAEGEPLIGPFLEQHPMPGWVGLDADEATHAAYQIHGLPVTVVIGPDGTIAAVCHPESLDAAMLRAQLPDRNSALLPPAE